MLFDADKKQAVHESGSPEGLGRGGEGGWERVPLARHPQCDEGPCPLPCTCQRAAAHSVSYPPPHRTATEQALGLRPDLQATTDWLPKHASSWNDQPCMIYPWWI